MVQQITREQVPGVEVGLLMAASRAETLTALLFRNQDEAGPTAIHRFAFKDTSGRLTVYRVH